MNNNSRQSKSLRERGYAAASLYDWAVMLSTFDKTLQLLEYYEIAGPKNDLKDWLLGRESYIAFSIEDFGGLQDVFVEVIGREAK